MTFSAKQYFSVHVPIVVKFKKMGCGGSTSSDQGQNSDDGQKVTYFHRQPKVSIRAGDEVRLLESNPKVVFVFG